MGLSSYEDVLYHALKDLLSVEKQFRDALPKLAKAPKNSERISKSLSTKAKRSG